MPSRMKRLLTVTEKHYITENMLRLTLTGDTLDIFPDGCEGGYVKLCFDKQGHALQATTLLGAGYIMRSYSIRAFDRQSNRLTIDMVDHTKHGEGEGPAAQWMASVQTADHIMIDGPGMVQRVDSSQEWVLLAGDMTALPAISVNLENLPDDAKGYAVIEVLSESDKQPLQCPQGIELHWVVNATPDQPNTCLVDAVKELPWLAGDPGVWVASEFESMRALRRYIRQEKGVSRGAMYSSSYWKMGESDEGNKRAKKQDTEA